MRYCKPFALILLLFGSTEIFAQTNFFDPASKLTWLGLDFTESRFIGGAAEFQTMDIHTLLTAWNELMLNEQSKYDIAGMLHRKSIEVALDAAINHNADLPLDQLMSYDLKLTRRLSADSIARIVSGYDFGGLSGNGIMFNIETFSKADDIALVWVTFVDIDNKTVLFTRRMQASPAGFGLRNYWAGAIYRIIKEIKVSYYREWSKQK